MGPWPHAGRGPEIIYNRPVPTYEFLKAPLPQDLLAQIVGLYRQEGWWDLDGDAPETVTRMVSGSHCFLAAVEAGALVGMGRAVSDGVSDAYIQDVVVRASHKGRGLGTRIVRELVGRLQGDGLGWIGLVAERGSRGFYRRLGFSEMPDSAPMLLKR
jgi:aralkylamine N-acetyltransferase